MRNLTGDFNHSLRHFLCVLVCAALFLSIAAFDCLAAATITVSDFDADGNVTISGNISSGAGRPVTILITNDSVDVKNDRLKGIRYSDSAISGPNGAYSFTCKPSDGGTYVVRINGGINDRAETTFKSPAPVLSILGSSDAPGDNTRLGAVLTNPGKIARLDFTIAYNAGVIIIAGDTNVRFPAGITCLAKDASVAGKVSCSIEITGAASGSTIEIVEIAAKIAANAPFGQYEVLPENVIAYDSVGNQLPMELAKGVFVIEAVSQKAQALEAARLALLLIPNPNVINIDNYTAQKVLVVDARTKINVAVDKGVRLSDFQTELLDGLMAVEQKITYMENVDSQMLALKTALDEDIDALLSKDKALFNIPAEMLAYYLTTLSDKSKMRASLRSGRFEMPEDVGAAFCVRLALEAVRQSRWGDLPEVFEHMNHILTLDLDGAYKSLSSEGKAAVHMAVAKNDFASPDDVRHTFNKAVDETAAWENRVGNPGGGLSGSSSSPYSASGNTAPAATVTPAPDRFAPAPKSFDDLDGVEWAQQSITSLVARGVVAGYEGCLFRPENKITREEFVKMLVVAFGLENPNASSDFSDVAPDAWYYPYISAAYNQGIVNGIGEGSFGVSREISRQEMATLAWRTAMPAGIALKDTNPALEFSDTDRISDYAKESVVAMQRAGIINGIGNGFFAPADSATRAMAAKVIFLLLEQSVE